ncbi:hypothetical protein OAA64_00830 [bacterium]|nr:hypothetical protein [bacterium]
MAARKFRFVSPGVFLKEIDQSQIPGIPEGIGPVIIGRTRKGPALKPYKIRSMEEFNRVFGAPMPGNQGEDPWRDGTHLLAESYAPYAAKAYLAAEIDSPVTIVRLAGIAGEGADATDGLPGWDVDSAHGLFLCNSSSTATDVVPMDLAAIFYGQPGFTCKLKGIPASSSAGATLTTSSVAILFDTAGKITMELGDGTNTKDVAFSFEDIRQSFNTNPVMTNAEIASPPTKDISAKYWLGESFPETYNQFVAKTPSADKKCAIIIPLGTLMEDFKSTNHGLTAARTGWIFGQMESTLTQAFEPEAQRKLFRLIALNEGTDAMKDLIISIEDIKIPRLGAQNRYGTFSVVVKRIFSTKLEEVERFDDCDLNPNSQNFITKKIGDQYFEWSSAEKRNKLYGGNPNISEYIRVDADPELESNPALELVPFGFYGPLKPASKQIIAQGGQLDIIQASDWLGGSNGQITLTGIRDQAVDGMTTASFNWPSSSVIHSSSFEQGYVMGATPFKLTYKSGSNNSQLPNAPLMNLGYPDTLRRLSSYSSNVLTGDQDDGIATAGTTDYSYKFSMDDVVLIPTGSALPSAISSRSDVAAAVWKPKSRNTAVDLDLTTAAAIPFVSFAAQCANNPAMSLRTLFDVVDGFHLPLAGGSDGVDITEANPFNMRVIDATSTAANSYAYASVDRALELIKDPEMIEHNLAVMPGITNESLTSKLVSTCEARADSLAIIDLPDVYVPPSQKRCTVFKDRVDGTTPEKSAAALVKRQLNSSYGCTYYPWVKIKDTQFNRDVWVPPSVVALGVMAYTEKRDDVWFAPAGFNRGGLNQGNAGLPVLQVSEQLLSKDRDTLYQANINPVASFVSEGIVIFGQKTLQSTQSALDRINVRRLLIFVKKMVSRVSNNLLFEQNVQATWKRFTNQVVPELESIKTRFGLSDFKVVLDSTTTTPDLIDRNIMYAKVFLKPARAIEFIAVDFVITNTGASFED